MDECCCYLLVNSELKEQALVDILDEQRRKEQLHWTLVFSNVIAQWAHWLGRQITEILFLYFVFECVCTSIAGSV